MQFFEESRSGSDIVRPKCFPIGSSFLKNFRKRFIDDRDVSRGRRILLGDAASSQIGFPMTSKYPAVTRSQEQTIVLRTRSRDVHPPRRRRPNRRRPAASTGREPRTIRRECSHRESWMRP